MRLLDGLMAFPALLLALTLVATLGANPASEIVALTIVFWPRTARLVRASTIALRERPFVEAAVAIGAPVRTILIDHILRNALAPLIAGSTFVYAEAMIADATLSFLGLGIKPPTPTWGNIIGDSRAYLVNAPWFSVFAGLAIVSAVLALNSIGDALRASADAAAGREGADS
jgi:peptide/nickel transport system permease protein